MIKVMGGAVGGEKQGMRLGMERGSAHLDHASINRRLRRGRPRAAGRRIGADTDFVRRVGTFLSFISAKFRPPSRQI